MYTHTPKAERIVWFNHFTAGSPGLSTRHIKIMLLPNISQQPCTSRYKVLLFSTVLYVVDDPENVDSLSTAIYMSTVTVTTVGYGTELS